MKGYELFVGIGVWGSNGGIAQQHGAIGHQGL